MYVKFATPSYRGGDGERSGAATAPTCLPPLITNSIEENISDITVKKLW